MTRFDSTTDTSRSGRHLARPLVRSIEPRLSQFSLGPTDDVSLKQFHQLVVGHIGAVGSFEVVFSTSGEPTIDQAWSKNQLQQHEKYRDLVFDWCRTARDSKSMQIGNNNDYALTTFCTPVICFGEVQRVWVAVVPKSNDGSVVAARDFEMASQYYSLWSERRLAFVSSGQLASMSRIIDWVSAIQKRQTIVSAAQAFVSELCKLPGIEYAGLILIRGRQTTLAAISGVAEVDNTSKASQQIIDCCNECLLHNEQACWPPTDSDPAHSLLAHRSLAEALGSPYAATHQLRSSDQKLIGVVVWAGDSNQLKDPNYRRLLGAAQLPITDVLQVVFKKQKSRIGRAVTRLVKHARTFSGTVVVGAIILSLFTLTVSVPYKVRCVCTLEPTIRRYAVAPFDGIVERGFVKAGDVVKAGQLLARMDERELRWELAGVSAEQHQAEKQSGIDLAEERIPQAMMSKLNEDRLDNRRRLFESRASQLEIRSLVDGFVLSGDLDKNENAPVRVGDALYEIGPITPIKVQFQIPSDEIVHVQEGQIVKIWIDGMARNPIERAIERVFPRSEMIDGRNVFVAEIELVNDQESLRPGMRGIAKITSASHPLGWSLFHKPWEFIVSRLSW